MIECTMYVILIMPYNVVIYLEGGEQRDFPPLRLIYPP